MTMLTGCGLFKPPTIINNTYPTVVVKSVPPSQFWTAMQAIGGTTLALFDIITSAQYNNLWGAMKQHVSYNRKFYAGVGTVAGGYLIAKAIYDYEKSETKETEDGKRETADGKPLSQSGTPQQGASKDTDAVKSPENV